MNRHVIALCAVALFCSLQGWPQEPPGEPTVTLKIEVTLPDGAVFYIPAVGDGEVLGIVTLPEGRYVGIRITPRMRSDSVRIDVSALTPTKRSCRKRLAMMYGDGIVKMLVLTTRKRMYHCCSRGWVDSVFPFSK